MHRQFAARCFITIFVVASTACGTGAETEWTRQVELTFSHSDKSRSSLRLDDGLIGEAQGDLELNQSRSLLLSSLSTKTLCVKGTFAFLDEIPLTTDTCPADLSGTWATHAFLTTAFQHTTQQSQVAGLGLLVQPPRQDTVYRLRVIGDAYDIESGRSSVTFEYAPVRK